MEVKLSAITSGAGMVTERAGRMVCRSYSRVGEGSIHTHDGVEGARLVPERAAAVFEDFMINELWDWTVNIAILGIGDRCSREFEKETGAS